MTQTPSHPTAADAALLHQRAAASGCTWRIDLDLDRAYAVDHSTRTVWVRGDLPLDEYHGAVVRGLDELGAPRLGVGTVAVDNVYPLHRPTTRRLRNRLDVG